MESIRGTLRFTKGVLPRALPATCCLLAGVLIAVQILNSRPDRKRSWNLAGPCLAVSGWVVCGWLLWHQRTGSRRESFEPAGLTGGPENHVHLAMEGVREYAIVMVDARGLVMRWNAGAERMLGYTPGEIVGRHYYSAFCPGDCGKTESAQAEGRMVRKDGSWFWANCVMTPITGPDGTVRGQCLIARDLTAQKASEEQLEAATQRAEAANRAKSEFLAVISHEIRTPMNAILGMADLLHESALSQEQRKYVEVFRRAGNNLLGLINDLLDLSKIESGHLELDRVEFDLLDVAGQATELVAQRARSKGVGLDVHLPEVRTTFRGDPARLRQILLNLLGNAVKFTESGKVTLTIAGHASGRPGHFEFSVADTGIGIAPEKLSTIFEDFSQADNSISRKYGGTGLGLGISRRLVGLMGGELTVTSRKGEGSIFRFDASFEPLAPAEPPPGAQPVEAAELKGLRAMVVDRDPANRALLRQTLGGWGVQVDEFCTGGEALLGLAGARYGVAFVQGSMRGLGGASLLTEMREAAPDLPMIQHESDQRSAENIGACVALRPIRRGELLQAVRKALTAPPRWEPVWGGKAPPAAGMNGGLRILIAEDSDDNRLLMEFYLKETPHRIVLAGDGQEAVELFQKEEFDLVLMDLQMPVMDGLTATRCIRDLESNRRLQRTPILAFTANAHGPDLHRSLVAGCNAHITKPISKPALLAAVERYGAPGEADASKPAVDSKEVQALIPKYVAARRRDLARLAQLLEAREFGEIRQIVHDIKGTGGAYGFPRLTELGAAMQASAEVSDPAALERQFAELAAYLWRSPA